MITWVRWLGWLRRCGRRRHSPESLRDVLLPEFGISWWMQRTTQKAIIAVEVRRTSTEQIPSTTQWPGNRKTLRRWSGGTWTQLAFRIRVRIRSATTVRLLRHSQFLLKKVTVSFFLRFQFLSIPEISYKPLVPNWSPSASVYNDKKEFENENRGREERSKELVFDMGMRRYVSNQDLLEEEDVHAKPSDTRCSTPTPEFSKTERWTRFLVSRHRSVLLSLPVNNGLVSSPVYISILELFTSNSLFHLYTISNFPAEPYLSSTHWSVMFPITDWHSFVFGQTSYLYVIFSVLHSFLKCRFPFVFLIYFFLFLGTGPAWKEEVFCFSPNSNRWQELKRDNTSPPNITSG